MSLQELSFLRSGELFNYRIADISPNVRIGLYAQRFFDHAYKESRISKRLFLRLDLSENRSQLRHTREIVSKVLVDDLIVNAVWQVVHFACQDTSDGETCHGSIQRSAFAAEGTRSGLCIDPE